MEYPRVPPGYSFSPQRVASDTRTVSTCIPSQLLSALFLVLHEYSDSDTLSLAVLPQKHIITLSYEPEWTLARLLNTFSAALNNTAPSAEVPCNYFLFCPQHRLQRDHPLLLSLVPSNNGVEILLSYDTLLLPTTEACWILSRLAYAVSRITASHPPSTDLHILSNSLISNSEHAQIISYATSCTQIPDEYPSCNTLPSLIASATRKYSTFSALSFYDPDDSSTLDISFTNLWKLANVLAQHIPKQDPTSSPRRAIIPICLPKSPNMIISMLAILISGYGYCNIEPSLPLQRRLMILDQLPVQSPLIVTSDSEFSNSVSTQSINPISILAPYIESLKNLDEIPYDIPETILDPLDSEDVAYVQFTSGSTGIPKGIIITHKNVVSFLKNYHKNFGRKAGVSRVLQFCSYGFDVMVMNIWDTLANGATVALTTQSHLHSDLAQAVLDTKATNVDLTPTVSEILLDASEPFTSAQDYQAHWPIRHLSTGAEAVGRSIRERWLARGVEVVQDYGPSETTVGVISTPLLATESHLVPIGSPIGSNRIYLLKESPSFDLVPLGCPGEICVSGPQVSPGYINSDLNNCVFVDTFEYGWLYRTGDLGAWIEDPVDKTKVSLQCFGRKDSQVKINGLRIELGEIEQHLNSNLNNNITKGIVQKVSRSQSSTLVCFLEISRQSSLYSHTDSEMVLNVNSNDFLHLTNQISQALGEKLPSYMVPRYFVPVSKIPTMSSGKVDRKLLGSLVASTQFLTLTKAQKIGSRTREASDAVNEADENTDTIFSEFRADILKAWAFVLNMNESDIPNDSSFVRLGGDSIMFIRLVSFLRRNGYANLVYGDLSGSLTVQECAKKLSEIGKQLSPPLHSTQPYYTRLNLLGKTSLEKDIIVTKVQKTLGLSKDEIDDILPTSPVQDSLIAGSAVAPSSYFAKSVYYLHPSIHDASKIVSAMNTLVRRQSVLRTVFVLVNGERRTFQVILNSECSTISLPTCKHFYVDDIDAAVQDYLIIPKQFEFGKILIDICILTSIKDPTKHCLLWYMHHALSDGWTLDLLQDDLAAILYGKNLPVRPDFGNIVKWWQEPQSQEDIEFWKKFFSQSKPRSVEQNTEQHLTSDVAEKIWMGKLQHFCRKSGITPAIVTRVAVEIALFSKGWLKSDSLTGIVRSGRDFADPTNGSIDATEIIGPCVSVLPSRMPWHGNENASVIDLLRKESQFDKESRQHQKIGISNLVSLSGTDNREALFDTLITYQNFSRQHDGDTSSPKPIQEPPEHLIMPTFYRLSVEITPIRMKVAANNEDVEKDDIVKLHAYYNSQMDKKTRVDEVLEEMGKVLDYICATDGEESADSLNKIYRFSAFEDLEPESSDMSSSISSSISAISTDVTAITRPVSTTSFIDANVENTDPIILGKVYSAWYTALDLDAAVEESEREEIRRIPFKELGGDSISLMRLMAQLRKHEISIPIAMLRGLSTIDAQARWLSSEFDYKKMKNM